VWFVQRDDVVENLAAAASHPAFRSPVLPGCLNTRALRPEARRLKKVVTSASNFESWSKMA
jgi:hypothetical protein